MEYVKFRDIPSEQIWAKFKEFFYTKSTDTESGFWSPCKGDNFYWININTLKSFIDGDDFETLHMDGYNLHGKFFK